MANLDGKKRRVLLVEDEKDGELSAGRLDRLMIKIQTAHRKRTNGRQFVCISLNMPRTLDLIC
jgi:hypothetical protein